MRRIANRTRHGRRQSQINLPPSGIKELCHVCGSESSVREVCTEAQGLRRIGVANVGQTCARTVLAELMEWHGITENAEAMTLALHHLHALGPEGSRPFFTPPRHEIVLSKNVALAFDRKSLLMIQKDPGDEVLAPLYAD